MKTLSTIIALLITLSFASCDKDEYTVTAKPLDTVRPAPPDERPTRDSVNLVKFN